MKGTIFDIQRFSVHDGPGIRTTVFMKGCPLRCRWCHNPEGLSKAVQLQFFEEKCIGCGKCGNREKLSDAANCPCNALVVCGKEYDEGEIVGEILRDRSFYGDMGGVTFSGGECLLQADFITKVLDRVKERGYSTAIDTCGYVNWNAFEKTLSVCDLYLYDIKCVTSHLHKEYTGVDNGLILENFERLCKTGKKIWIRIPVIPGFNNTVEEMAKISGLLTDKQCVEQVTLMPYHTLGMNKYKTLGLECEYNTDLRITEQELTAFKEMFELNGIKVK